MCQDDLSFQISCAPKRFLVQYLLYTNAKGSEPNISACVEHARGAWRPPWLEIFSSSRLCIDAICAMCNCVLSKYHPIDFQVPLLTTNPLQNWATPGRSSQREVLRRFSRRGASNHLKKRNKGWIKKPWKIFQKLKQDYPTPGEKRMTRTICEKHFLAAGSPRRTDLSAWTKKNPLSIL